MSVAPLRRCAPWPADVAARYRAAGAWSGESFDAFLRARARRFAARTAVVGPDGERWSYARLDARADALAAGLADAGVRPGERVLVQLPNGPTYVALLFGLWRAGAIPVLALPAHRHAELAAIARDADAAALVTTRRHGGFDHAAQAVRVAAAVPSLRLVATDAELAALPDRPSPGRAAASGAVALLLLSGGTTGTPKLIPRTADDYLYSVRRSAEVCALGPATVALCVLPAAHNFPLSSPGLLGVLHAGGAVVLAATPDPQACFAQIARERVTTTALVPPLLLAWLDAAAAARGRLDSLELVQVGGAKLAPQVARRVRPELGCALQQVFGMAEGLVCYTRPEDDEALVCTTQGRPMSPLDELRVVDGDGAPVPDGEPGLLEARGPYTVRGYYGDADPDAFTADGFYRTGDVVRRLASGHLVVEGRAKDQINRGGEKIAPDEVEGHLLAHPAVHDAAIVAVPDERLGERTCAVIVAAGGGAPPAAAELRRFLRERGLAAYKLPDRIETVAAFPRTGVGKTSRRDLRAAVAASLTDTHEERQP